MTKIRSIHSNVESIKEASSNQSYICFIGQIFQPQLISLQVVVDMETLMVTQQFLVDCMCDWIISRPSSRQP